MFSVFKSSFFQVVLKYRLSNPNPQIWNPEFSKSKTFFEQWYWHHKWKILQLISCEVSQSKHRYTTVFSASPKGRKTLEPPSFMRYIFQACPNFHTQAGLQKVIQWLMCTPNMPVSGFPMMPKTYVYSSVWFVVVVYSLLCVVKILKMPKKTCRYSCGEQ